MLMVVRRRWSRSKTLESLAHGVKRRRYDARQREECRGYLKHEAEAFGAASVRWEGALVFRTGEALPPSPPPAQMECETAERGVQGSVVAREAGAVSLPPAERSGRFVVVARA